MALKIRKMPGVAVTGKSCQLILSKLLLNFLIIYNRYKYLVLKRTEGYSCRHLLGVIKVI